MRERKKCVVLSFHTTTEAMAFEKAAMEKGVPGRLIPLPREISAGCGMAWKAEEADYEQYKMMFQEGVYEGIYKMML